MKPIIIEYKEGLSIREKMLLFLLGVVIPIHAKFYFKRKPLGMRREDLFRCPEGTLGRELALFLKDEQLEPVPRVERHDAFHILFDYSTQIRDEAAMQFFLIANGKISPFTVGTAIFAGLMLPEEWGHFRGAFRQGKQLRSIARWDFQYLLGENFSDIRNVLRGIEVQNPRLMQLVESMESGTFKPLNYELR